MLFKIFDASKPDSFSGTLGGADSQITMPSREKKYLFSPEAYVSSSLKNCLITSLPGLPKAQNQKDSSHTVF